MSRYLELSLASSFEDVTFIFEFEILCFFAIWGCEKRLFGYS